MGLEMLFEAGGSTVTSVDTRTGYANFVITRSRTYKESPYNKYQLDPSTTTSRR